MTRTEHGIDQLIQRIRVEAIGKAQEERDAIVKQAQADAAAIVEQAKHQAETLLADARTQIKQEKRTMTTELELAARDFTLKFHERLKEQLFFPAIKENIRITMREPAFLKDVLGRLLIDYTKNNSSNLDVLIPKQLKTTLATYFAGAIFDALDKSCEVRLIDEEGMEGFVLLHRGDHFVWDFRVDTIAEELLRLIEPQLRKFFTSPPLTRAAAMEASKA